MARKPETARGVVTAAPAVTMAPGRCHHRGSGGSRCSGTAGTRGPGRLDSARLRVGPARPGETDRPILCRSRARRPAAGVSAAGAAGFAGRIWAESFLPFRLGIVPTTVTVTVRAVKCVPVIRL